MIDTRGMPRIWRHFLYGLRVMHALDARESLRMAGAMGTPNMKDDDRRQWFAQQERAAGW